MSIRRISQLLLYWPRARHVLATEGAGPLLRKVVRRLRTTPLRVPYKPEVFPVREPFEPIVFERSGDPRFSIVVPVFDRFAFTHRCLAALASHSSGQTFEVIVVDDRSTDGTAERLAAYQGVRCVRQPENRGFVDACNAGAAAAQGELLVFLNNDALVQRGWLDALWDLFERRPEAGLVGSKLIYPDGRLQEAGGVLFADASAWNYGHLDDPYKPCYSYVREPDYCSGAALAIRKNLFDALSGFDRHFAPGYYEDADLAMRVRAAGFKVYYDPHAVAVHFEGISSGTDRDPVVTGMKRFQAINRDKFLARWGRAICDWGVRGDDLERTKERRISRRAFISDNYMPTPDRDSGSLRLWSLFRILQDLGYKVTFGAVNLEAREPYLSRLQSEGVECLYRPYVRSPERHLAEYGAFYDLVVLCRADTAARLMAPARRHCPNARIVFDTVDLHFLRESRFGELTGKRATRRIAERRKKQELNLVERADDTLVVSAAEREILLVERPRARVHLVSNIHRICPNEAPFEDRRDILFIGAFAHPPNMDAVRWLVLEILPLIRARLPEVRCHVVGADPPAEIRALASPSAIMHGYVPDVGHFFAGCRLSVAPLRYGAGVKGKIGQSLAYGLPVVATSQGAEGMYLADGESALIADTAADFAAATLRLYTDAALWARLSESGKSVIEAHFSIAAARQSLLAVLNE